MWDVQEGDGHCEVGTGKKKDGYDDYDDDNDDDESW